MADRFFDFAARKTYQETFDKPKESVHRALYAFSSIGTIILIPRALLFIRALSHVYIGDDVGVFRCVFFSVAMQVVLEAFPQSVIAKLYLNQCPVTGGPSVILQAFEVFSALPSIVFFCVLCWFFCRRGNEDQYCGSILPTSAISVVSMFSLVNLVLAILALYEGHKNCH